MRVSVAKYAKNLSRATVNFLHLPSYEIILVQVGILTLFPTLSLLGSDDKMPGFFRPSQSKLVGTLLDEWFMD